MLHATDVLRKKNERAFRFPWIISLLLMASLALECLANYHSIYVVITSGLEVTPLVYRVLAWVPLFLAFVLFVIAREYHSSARWLWDSYSPLRRPPISLCAVVVALSTACG